MVASSAAAGGLERGNALARSLAHLTVDRLAQHVGVPVVTRVLLDHVER